MKCPLGFLFLSICFASWCQPKPKVDSLMLSSAQPDVIQFILEELQQLKEAQKSLDINVDSLLKSDEEMRQTLKVLGDSIPGLAEAYLRLDAIREEEQKAGIP